MEVRTIIQARENDGLGYSDGSEVSEQGLVLDYVLKVEPGGLANMGYEEKREMSRWLQGF